MQIDILTVFPEMFSPLDESMVKRAQENNLLDIATHNIRDYTKDKHNMTDDKLYGGGAGMVMKPEPIFAAVEAVKKQNVDPQKQRIIITSPAGETFNQAKALELSKAEQLIFICGHYEGIDQRVEDSLATDVISLGDFVLTGGEMATLAIVDAVARLVPGVLGAEASAEEESFSESLLEYPHYTRPAEFAGEKVPEVLLSGHHENIEKWRREQSLERTLARRPELLEKAPLTQTDLIYLKKIKKQKSKSYRLFLALMHYPVYNKKRKIINTSLTNLDLHDIARAAQTYGVENFFLVQPIEKQRQLMDNLINHWQKGFGSHYNPDRKTALERVFLKPYLEDVMAYIEEHYDAKPKIIATSAQVQSPIIGYKEMRNLMHEQGGNYLLLLGTGWGLADEVLAESQFVLRPIYGTEDYNHLSVRSAASIVLDRLQGEIASRY